MKGLLFLRMYDPVARKFWLKRCIVRGKSEDEIAAKMVRIKARHRLWKGGRHHG